MWRQILNEDATGGLPLDDLLSGCSGLGGLDYASDTETVLKAEPNTPRQNRAGAINWRKVAESLKCPTTMWCGLEGGLKLCRTSCSTPGCAGCIACDGENHENNEDPGVGDGRRGLATPCKRPCPEFASAATLPLPQGSQARQTPRTNLAGASGATAKQGTAASAYRGVEPRIAEMIESEILDTCANKVLWEDIAGLEHVKQAVRETVIWPMQRPDLFAASALRKPSRGVLLFGPPGSGKTLIARCIASQVSATFFSISASSLTSKWVGEGEKLVRGLFAVARAKNPSVIFIDEIDSLLTSRTEGEHDASRRIKTEFLVQFDGAGNSASSSSSSSSAKPSTPLLLVIGATNRPQELDEAARRRFTRRLYVPLPCIQSRKTLMQNIMRQLNGTVTEEQLTELAKLTEGYSGADISTLCEEASMAVLREAAAKFSDLSELNSDSIRPLTDADMRRALTVVKPSVSQRDVGFHENWNTQYGSYARNELEDPDIE